VLFSARGRDKAEGGDGSDVRPAAKPKNAATVIVNALFAANIGLVCAAGSAYFDLLNLDPGAIPDMALRGQRIGAVIALRCR
jgi:hypothetical protein